MNRRTILKSLTGLTALAVVAPVLVACEDESKLTYRPGDDPTQMFRDAGLPAELEKKCQVASCDAIDRMRTGQLSLYSNPNSVWTVLMTDGPEPEFYTMHTIWTRTESADGVMWVTGRRSLRRGRLCDGPDIPLWSIAGKLT